MRVSFGICCATLGLCGSLGLPAFAASRPNLVVMMTDDQAAIAMSCAGNTVLKTPNMDRLAAEGLTFRNAFVTNALCAPSRTTLLSGLYSHTHGVRDNRQKAISPDIKLVSDYLREGGYEVAFCGKSHVDPALRDRQWDYYFGYLQQGSYINPKIAEGVNGPDKVYEGYMDDIVTDHAIAWLNSRKSDKPFCLFLFFKGSHRAWLRDRRHHDLFNGVAVPKPPTYDDDLAGNPGNKPQAFINADNKIGDFIDVRSLETFLKDYYATLTAVDENVGKVYAALKASGTLDDTAIMYTSDNGFFLGEWRRFDKRFMHEPSSKVPMLIRYPKLAKAGSTTQRMVINVDIAPTLLDLAGLPIPEQMHGRSMQPLLKDPKAAFREDWLYEYYEYPAEHSVPKHRGVRTERYKYIHYYEEPQEFELYDLQEDPGERMNIYGKAGTEQITTKLKQRLEELRRETKDPDVK